MEKDNFDEEFKHRIKQVFEEYDDSTADEGWALLREKYPEKKRRDGFLWWISSAAAVLLVAFIFWFFPSGSLQKNTSQNINQRVKEPVSALPNHYLSKQKKLANSVSADTINTEKAPVKTASEFANRNPSANKSVQKQVYADSTHTEKTPVKTASEFANRNPSANKSVQKQVYADPTHAQKTPVKTASDFAAIQKSQPKIVTEKQSDTVFTGIKQDPAPIATQYNLLKDAKKTVSENPTLATVTKSTNPETAKPAAPKKYPETKILKKETKKTAAFSLEVYAGSHVNYATGSNNQLGLGAGFSTEFRLSKNFKLSTGLGLMQNNLTYSQDIPRGSLDAASSTYSIAASTTGTGSLTINPGLSTMNTHLLALDVPVNLVYNFSPGKNSISVSAGISSNTFVKEAYDYHYSNATSTTQTVGSFNNFNFAKTLNLAAGFAYPLGKNKLQIEPFLKYPLGGSGSQQLQFGSAGINLKMNIQSFKK